LQFFYRLFLPPTIRYHRASAALTGKGRLGLAWRDIGGPAAWMRPRSAGNDRDRRISLGAVVEAGASYGATVTVSAAPVG